MGSNEETPSSEKPGSLTLQALAHLLTGTHPCMHRDAQRTTAHQPSGNCSVATGEGRPCTHVNKLQRPAGKGKLIRYI